MRNRGTLGEQWTFCARCGFEFPISQLSAQKGVLVCELCYDDPVPALHDSLVQRALESAIQDQEGANDVDSAFFAGLHDEELV